MKEQGTKITENMPPPMLYVMEIQDIKGTVVHGKEQGGTDLWLQLVKDCQRVHLNFHPREKEFVTLTSLDG